MKCLSSIRASNLTNIHAVRCTALVSTSALDLSVKRSLQWSDVSMNTL